MPMTSSNVFWKFWVTVDFVAFGLTMISSDEYLKRYMLTCNKWTTNLAATFIFSIQTRAWYRTTMLAYKMVPEPIDKWRDVGPL